MTTIMEATPGFEPGDQGFADPCLTTWLCRLKFNTSASIEITKSNHILIGLICNDGAQSRT